MKWTRVGIGALLVVIGLLVHAVGVGIAWIGEYIEASGIGIGEQ